jgi:hypothetical protein
MMKMQSSLQELNSKLRRVNRRFFLAARHNPSKTWLLLSLRSVSSKFKIAIKRGNFFFFPLSSLLFQLSSFLSPLSSLTFLHIGLRLGLCARHRVLPR